MAHWLGRKFQLKMPEVLRRFRKDRREWESSAGIGLPETASAPRTAEILPAAETQKQSSVDRRPDPRRRDVDLAGRRRPCFPVVVRRFVNKASDLLVDVSGPWPDPKPFPAMVGNVSENTVVTIHIANVGDKYTRRCHQQSPRTDRWRPPRQFYGIPQGGPSHPAVDSCNRSASVRQ